MLVRFLKSALLAVFLIVVMALPILAAWQFVFPTGVTDTSYATRTYYPVMLGFNGQAFVDADKIASNGTDTNMQVVGSDIKYMLSTDNVAAVVPSLPAGGVVTVNFYTGWTPVQTAFPVVVGEDGRVTVTDDDDMEIGDNFTILLNGALRSGVYGDIFVKGSSGRLYESTSGNLTGYLLGNWTSQASAANLDWWAVDWSPSLGLFAAVADDGTGNGVMTSANGTGWVIRVSASDNAWQDVVWSPELGLFAAVSGNGTGNRVMTSENGTGWVARVSAADNSWTDITWSPEQGIFAAVSSNGTGNRVMISTDGITWSTQTSAADNNWYGIAWSPELGLFAAVSANGTGNRVMTSPDGSTWTLRNSAADDTWYGVAWSPELNLFAAVSGSGTIMTSPDGIMWTLRTSPSGAPGCYSVTWVPDLGLFVAVGTAVTNRVMTSADGITWVTQPVPVADIWRDVAWSPSLDILAATSGGPSAGTRVMTASAYMVESSFTEGHRKLEFYADATDLFLEIDDVVTDNVSLVGAVAANTTDNWWFMGNPIAYADNISLSVDGAEQLLFAPTVMLSGATLPDEQAVGGDNDGTVTWGSNSDATLGYGELSSYDDYYATANITGGFDMPEATMPSTWFAAGENVSALPFYESFANVALETGQPVQTLYALAVVGVAMGVFLLVVVFTRSALMGYLAMVLIFGFGASMTIIPAWIVFVLAIVGTGIMYLYRQTAY